MGYTTLALSNNGIINNTMRMSNFEKYNRQNLDLIRNSLIIFQIQNV